MIGTTARKLWGRKRFQATTYGQLCGSLAVACALVALVVVGLGSAAAAGPPTLARANLAGDPIPVDVLSYPAGSAGSARLQPYATT